jgi:hypothetical protein
MKRVLQIKLPDGRYSTRKTEKDYKFGVVSVKGCHLWTTRKELAEKEVKSLNKYLPELKVKIEKVVIK